MALWNPLQQLFSTGSNVTETLQLRIVSFNIRYATSSPFTNERPWAEREPLVLNQLSHELRYADSAPAQQGASAVEAPYSSAAFVCLQEVLHGQLVDILAGLNKLPAEEKTGDPPDGSRWAHIGVGRDDGHQGGEYSPILYPAKTFSLLHYETTWLSPTPDRPSKGWDAGSIRILTVGVFEHRRTGKRLVAANTHLDNAGTKSRSESIKIILRTLRGVHARWSRGGEEELGVFLAGDFNSFPEQEAYVAMEEDGWMRDLHGEIAPRMRYGEKITFTGFQPEKDKDEQGRIDFIWLGPARVEPGSADEGSLPWTPTGYAVLPNIFEDGVYLSDHRAVVGDVQLSP